MLSLESIVAEPAEEELLKEMKPPTLLKFVISPAVEPLLKKNPPATNDCVVPELFTMPVPYRAMLSKALIVYCGAPGLNTRLSRSTITLVLMTSVTFDASNVAMSEVPFGTVLGIQFAAVFQSLLEGLVAHVAL